MAYILYSFPLFIYLSLHLYIYIYKVLIMCIPITFINSLSKNYNKYIVVISCMNFYYILDI